MKYPTVERHYLTKEGDMVDAICWRYYGVTDGPTEAVYERNGFLSYENVILPGMLLIVLPIISSADSTTVKRFWTSKTRKLYVPAGTTTSASASSSAVLTDGCCADNAPVVQEADWIAVYIQNEKGDWVLRRIHKNNIIPSDSTYGASTLSDPSFFL